MTQHRQLCKQSTFQSWLFALDMLFTVILLFPLCPLSNCTFRAFRRNTDRMDDLIALVDRNIDDGLEL